MSTAYQFHETSLSSTTTLPLRLSYVTLDFEARGPYYLTHLPGYTSSVYFTILHSTLPSEEVAVTTIFGPYNIQEGYIIHGLYFKDACRLEEPRVFHPLAGGLVGVVGEP